MSSWPKTYGPALTGNALGTSAGLPEGAEQKSNSQQRQLSPAPIVRLSLRPELLEVFQFRSNALAEQNE
jgi:hypothetical protein